MNTLRKDAEKLRAEGYSYNLIHQKLGVSKSTMSYWFKNSHFVPNQQVLDRIRNGPALIGIERHNKRVKEINDLKKEGIKELGKLSKRDLWLIGIGLYIGEGSKTIEAIRVVNSDPKVIRLAVRWLKDICKLSTDNITIALHIYPDNSEEKCIKYWQQITDLPRKNFRKTQVDRRLNKKVSKKGKLPYGTVHLHVVSNGDVTKGVKLYRRMNGWIAGVMNQV
ncbi:MAG: hypothetical protein ACR2KZ_04395 [Segetibacter sp.]